MKPLTIISISIVFSIPLFALKADEDKGVPNLAEHASVTSSDSWVSKTPGVLSRKDAYRIRTLEFDHQQSVGGYTFSSIAMVFDSDNLTTINFGGSLRESLPMQKGEIKLSCNGQVLVKQGQSEVPILLYAPDGDNPFPRFVGSTINDENAASGWITVTDSQQKQLKLPLLEFRIGETLVRCVIAEKSAMESKAPNALSAASDSTNETVSPNALPGEFLGKWVALGNTNQYVLVTASEIRWERGATDGPDLVPASKWIVSQDKQSVSFPVRSDAAAVVSGRLVTGTMNVKMTVTGSSLSIAEEGNSTTVKDPASGFSFQQTSNTKYEFERVADK